VLRGLDLEREALGTGLSLPVPQKTCSFRFGPRQQALPAGALLRIWTRDKDARGRCPQCKGPGRAEGFGGLLSTGGYMCVCLHCGHGWLKHLGGLGRMMERVRPLLEGTPWYLNGARFGAAVGDEGAELGKALGLPGWEGKAPEGGISMKLGPHNLELDLEG